MLTREDKLKIENMIESEEMLTRKKLCNSMKKLFRLLLQLEPNKSPGPDGLHPYENVLQVLMDYIPSRMCFRS